MDDLNLATNPNPHDDLLITMAQALDYLNVNEKSHLCVGLSGGLDSVVLLHLLVKLQQQYPCRLSAVHIHHGISQRADDWLTFCQKRCETWSVPFSAVRLAPLDSTHTGLENAARKARYTAFYQQPAPIIALAHHQHDQAETLLLQLFRGTGLAGLAAMSPISQQGKKTLWRPLLTIPRQCLLDWAKKHQLEWIEDESNQDVHYRRNAIRHEILPAIQRYWPNVTHQLLQTSLICQESLLLINNLATLDAEECISPQQVLDILKLQALSYPRAINLLRYWITRQLKQPIAHKKQLEEMYRQLIQFDTTSTGQGCFLNIRFGWYRATLYPVDHLPAHTYRIHYQGESSLALPGYPHHLRITPTTGQGIKASLLHSGKITIANQYTQQQKMAVSKKRPRKTLKQIFQDHAIPFWLRQCWPLIFYEDQLIAIVNLVIDPAVKAQTDEPGFLITSIVPEEVTVTSSASPSSLSTDKNASTTTGSN